MEYYSFDLRSFLSPRASIGFHKRLKITRGRNKSTEDLEGHFYLSLITYYLLLITYNLLLITYYLLLITYYLLLITYHIIYHPI